jgi:hypothetical protein
MSESEAKFHVGIDNFIIEIVGSEEYVKGQVEVFRPILLSKMGEIPASNPEATRVDSAPATIPASTRPTSATAQEPDNPYPNVMQWDSTQTRLLLTEVPGKTQVDKMKDLILLYLLAKHLQHVDAVSNKELIALCNNHGCLAAGHFALAYKDKKLFLVNGGTRSAQISLTMPGIAAAKDLAQSINEAAN